MKNETPSQCVVTAEDYLIHWRGASPEAPSRILTKKPPYGGPERRKNAHDRRWFNNGGGRRRFDRKS